MRSIQLVNCNHSLYALAIFCGCVVFKLKYTKGTKYRLVLSVTIRPVEQFDEWRKSLLILSILVPQVIHILFRIRVRADASKWYRTCIVK